MKDLHAIITPSLLKQLGHARRPWPKTGPISGDAIMAQFVLDEPDFTSHAASAWPALLTLSHVYGPSTVPDVTGFLPPPTSDGFPEQALGMHVLLDQCPRVLFKGVHGRWTSWFDKVVRKLYAFFHGLPEPLRPWTRARWADASFEYWFCAATEFYASMAHQESQAHQEASAAFMEELRGAVEKHAGQRDPVRDDAARWKDVYAMPRVLQDVDLSRHWAFHEAAFFVIKVHEVHKPIIDRYGRYPYRNAVEGRDSTEEEREWVEKTDHFAEAGPDVAKKVRQDVEAGRWRPLGRDEDDDEPEARVNDVSSEACLKIMIQASERKR